MDYTTILLSQEQVPYERVLELGGKPQPGQSLFIEGQFQLQGETPTEEEQDAIDTWFEGLKRTWAEKELIKILNYWSAALGRYLVLIQVLSLP